MSMSNLLSTPLFVNPNSGNITLDCTGDECQKVSASELFENNSEFVNWLQKQPFHIMFHLLNGETLFGHELVPEVFPFITSFDLSIPKVGNWLNH